MEVQVKIVIIVTGLHNFIQSYCIIRNIYDKTQLDAEHLLMHLSHRKEEVEEQDIHTSVNTSRGDGTQMNWFRDEITKAIWQDYVSY